MSLRTLSRAASLALGMSLSNTAFAQRFVKLDLGIQSTLGTAIGYLINFLAVVALPVCTALFVLGAFFLVLSRGKEDQIKRGKDLMLGSAEGLAVIIGSYGILRMFLYLLYP